MKNIGTIELETNRLLFRKASTSDSKDMFNNWASDKEVTKYLSWDAYEKEENAVSYLKYLEEEYTKDNFYNWIVVSKEDNTPIGTIGAVDIDNKEYMDEVFEVSKYARIVGLPNESFIRIKDNDIDFVGKHYFIENGVME